MLSKVLIALGSGILLLAGLISSCINKAAGTIAELVRLIHHILVGSHLTNFLAHVLGSLIYPLQLLSSIGFPLGHLLQLLAILLFRLLQLAANLLDLTEIVLQVIDTFL